MKAFEFFLAWRYLRGSSLRKTTISSSKHRSNFLSFVSLVSIGGIALGVCALIVVVSVMNGFHRDVKENILGVVSHATVRPLAGYQYTMQEWLNLRQQLFVQNKEIIAAAPFIDQQGLISQKAHVQPVAVRGISPSLETTVADFVKTPIAGDIAFLSPGSFRAMIGADLASILGLQLGDRFTLLAPQGSFSPIGIVPRIRRFEVAGIFRANLYEYDAGLILINIDDARRLYQKNSADGLRLRFTDVFNAQWNVYQLNQSLPQKLYTQDWSASHANFFRAVQIEKRMMFLILSIIIAVAAFNVVNQQMMLIGEKNGDIAILRTLGVSSAAIVRIFLLQGLFLGCIGILTGLLGGIITALNVESIVKVIESIFQIKFLAPDIYQIPEIPSQIKAMDVLLTAAVAFSVTVLATIYPSYRASKVEPAKALRYE